MQYRLKWVVQQDVAWSRIAQWGYPTLAEEFSPSMMIEVGEGAAYFWFEAITEKDLMLHMAASPEHRGRFMTKHVVAGLRMSAELLGADYIWVVTDIEPVIDYIKRLGFTDMGGGWRWSI